MNAGWSARLRSAATLVALLVVLLVGVAWGWSAVTAPLPGGGETAVCSLVTVREGQKVYPDQVTVSVLNAGDREGLAGRTMQDLVDQGFAEGSLANAPEDAKVELAEIWTDDIDNPAVRLVRRHLGGVDIVRRDPLEPGVNVVVGDDFTKVRKGRRFARADQDAQVCSPPGSLS